MSAPSASGLALSLILVSYHSGRPLRRFFASRERNPVAAAHEILVVDNSPGDDVAPWLAAEHPDVRVITMERNVGYARAVNAGLQAAAGEHLLVVNPDVELSEGGVDAALDYLRRNPEVGMVGAQLLDEDGSLQRNARRFYSLTSILLRRTPLGRLRPRHPEIRRHLMLDDDLSRPGPVDWVTGAFMLVRREALDSVGAMDERFFLYFEDVDWCYRMWEGGWEVHLVPHARFVHQYQRTSTRIGRPLVHHLRSFLNFYDKWGALVYVARQLRGRWRTAAAVLADVVALNLAFLAAFFVRRLLDPLFPQELFDLVDYLPLIALTNLVSLITLPLMGRYGRGAGVGRWSGRLESLRAAFFVTLVVMAVTYLSHTRTFSRAVLLLFVPMYLGALELTRRLRDRILGGADRQLGGCVRSLLVGEAHALERLFDGLQLPPPGRSPRVVGAVTVDGAGPGRLRPLGSWEDLPTVVDRYRVTELLLEGDRRPPEALAAAVRRAAIGGCEALVDEPWAEALGPGRSRARYGRAWWPVPPLRASVASGTAKLWLDRPVALVLCLLSVPGFVLCSALGRPFGLVAVRTLRRVARRQRIVSWPELVGRGSGVPLPGLVQLPRFWQVLTGRLSLVGPYPVPAGSEEAFGPVQLLRFTVRPGLAGPWQRHRAPASLAELTGDDLDYLENWSPALDLDLFLGALPRLLLTRRSDPLAAEAAR